MIVVVEVPEVVVGIKIVAVVLETEDDVHPVIIVLCLSVLSL